MPSATLSRITDIDGYSISVTGSGSSLSTEEAVSGIALLIQSNPQNFQIHDALHGENIELDKGRVLGLFYHVFPRSGLFLRVLHGHASSLLLDLRRNSPSEGKMKLIDLPSRDVATRTHWIWIPPWTAQGFFCHEDSRVQIVYALPRTTDYSGILSPHADDINWSDCPEAFHSRLSTAPQSEIGQTVDFLGAAIDVAETTRIHNTFESFTSTSPASRIFTGAAIERSSVPLSPGTVSFDPEKPHFSCWLLKNYFHYCLFEISKICCVYGRSPGLDLNDSRSPGRDFMNFRNTMEEELNQGKHVACSNCPRLTWDDWGGTSKINSITLYPSPRCNIRCYYCSNEQHKPFDRGYTWDDAKEVVESMLRDEILDTNFSMDMMGGEPMILHGFEDFINFILHSTECSGLHITTNASVLSSAVIEGLKLRKITIRTSPDAGTAETFRQIKGSDIFDRTMSNIQAYVNASPGNVIVKYILLPENIDNTNMESFLKLMHDYGTRVIELAINVMSNRQDEAAINIVKAIGQFQYLADSMGLYTYTDYKFLLDGQYPGNDARKLVDESYRSGLSHTSVPDNHRTYDYMPELGHINCIAYSDQSGLKITGTTFDARTTKVVDEISIFFEDKHIFSGKCHNIDPTIHDTLKSGFIFTSADTGFADRVLSSQYEKSISAFVRYDDNWFRIPYRQSH